MRRGLELGNVGKMNTDLTRLVDVIMGEAVVALLRSEDHISVDTLAMRLRAMSEGEKNPEKRNAIALALCEVQREFLPLR